MMKKLIFFGILLAMELANAGQISNRVSNDKKIIFGTEGTFPPFSFRDELGQLTGFDVEVARAVGKKLDLEVQFKEIEWGKMFQQLENKKIDSIADQISILPERMGKFDFSNHYFYTYDAIAVLDDDKNTATYKSFSDLKDKKVAISKDDAQYQRVVDSGAKIVAGKNGLIHVMKALRAKKADAVVNIDAAIMNYIKQHPEAGIKIAFIDESQKSFAAFPFVKDEEELVSKVNKAISELIADGTIKSISTKFFGNEVSDRD